MESLIPKWTKVTVYEDAHWGKWKMEGVTIPIQHKGYLLSFLGSESDRCVQMINEEGRIILVDSPHVQFHLGEVFDPNKKDLIPVGTRVICYENDSTGNVSEKCRANFLRFGHDYQDYGDCGIANYSSVVVLRDDGQMENFRVDNIKVCTEEEKEENPILNRLRAINE